MEVRQFNPLAPGMASRMGATSPSGMDAGPAGAVGAAGAAADAAAGGAATMSSALAEGKIREREGYVPLHMSSLCLLLTQISQIVIDHPALRRLLINPALVAGETILVADADIHISAEKNPYPLAIRPYPKELEEVFLLRNERSVLLRPIRPEDELNLQAFDNSQSKEDRYKRYFAELPQFSHEQMARLTQIDYEREMAFVAVANNAQGDEEILGVVRAQRDPDNTFAEFAMAIRSDLKGIGLGARMLKKMIDYLKSM